MNTGEWVLALEAVLQADSTTASLPPHLRCERAARRAHLAAGRADWPAYDAALRVVLRAWEPEVPDAVRAFARRHFLPVLHLTGLPPENRATALKRMPITLYREWRELNDLMDEARDASD